ncbi:MAG TPA: helix-turn-helix domain-containing protein [Terriglobales bacterium]|nr:helix-turn-helix domain-containing protein [Terriglobales bacterium]
MNLKQTTKQVQQDTELLTVPETAALFKVQVSTIRAWVLHKRIPYVKVFGKLVRFRRADIESLLAARVVPAKAN